MLRRLVSFFCCSTTGLSTDPTSQLTHVIAEKEKKSSSYKDGKLDVLSDEKTSKIKKFAKEYITKVLRRLEKSKRKASSDAPAASSVVANIDELDHEEGGDVPMVMSVEQAMDLDDGSESEADNAVGGDDAEMQDIQHSSDDVDPSPKEGVAEHPPQSLTPITPPEQTFDPRMRHRVDELGGPSKYCWDSST
jgi:histone-lysine N-methyltransferase SETD2